MPRLSVIIPNYNHSQFLEERVDSVMNQSFKDMEVLLFDDCSTDDSQAVISKLLLKYPEIQFYQNKKNSGSPFHQWNKGIHMADGEYIWVAESDDIADPELCTKLIELLDRNEKTGIAYAQSHLIDENSKKLNSYADNLKFIYKTKLWESNFEMNGKEFCKKYVYFHNPIPNASGAIFRKQAIENAGLADPSMKLNGDWFLYAKILCKYDVSFLAEELNYFRVHDRTQRHRAQGNPDVYIEILKIMDYLHFEIDKSDAVFEKSLKRISNWWAGSLFHQKWTIKKRSKNWQLYKRFRKYHKALLLSIIYIFIVLSSRFVLKKVGLLKPAKKLRNIVFPNKYFNP